MENQKKEEYCLKANSVKEAIQQLNALPFSEKEKTSVIILGILLYEICMAVEGSLTNPLIQEGSEEFKKIYLKMKLKEVVDKYIRKNEKEETDTPGWVSLFTGFDSLEKKEYKGLQKVIVNGSIPEKIS